ncbi:hypothetical protein TNCV_4495111 [Trichonephila clavipes]|nr:hypothetical protein TNCV_4495111 [Trichonephila clavipes]
MYCNGSATDGDQNADVVFYSEHLSFNWAFDTNCTSYDAELALTKITKRDKQNIVVFIDAQAAIKAMPSVLLLNNLSVLSCQPLINSLMDSGLNITLQWIPSHCGIIGIEFAHTGQGWFLPFAS